MCFSQKDKHLPHVCLCLVFGGTGPKTSPKWPPGPWKNKLRPPTQKENLRHFKSIFKKIDFLKHLQNNDERIEIAKPRNIFLFFFETTFQILWSFKILNFIYAKDKHLQILCLFIVFGHGVQHEPQMGSRALKQTAQARPSKRKSNFQSFSNKNYKMLSIDIFFLLNLSIFYSFSRKTNIYQVCVCVSFWGARGPTWAPNRLQGPEKETPGPRNCRFLLVFIGFVGWDSF